MFKYKAKPIRCVDGDTIDFIVDLGFHVLIKIRARLIGVNTPERGHQDYKLATQKLQSLLNDVMDDDGNIIIETHKTGKYGRWLVNINGVNSVMAKEWPYE